MKRMRDERGIALAVAIFALVIVGALVSAAFFVGIQEQNVGRNTIKLDQAFSAADGGAEATVSGWVKTTNNINVGDSITISRTALASNAGWYRGSVKKLTADLFLVRIEGFSQDSTARQSVGVVVRLRPIQINITAALKTEGALSIGGSSLINGNDTPPAGWTGCPPSQGSLPAIQIKDSTQISFSGCNNMSCLSGSPLIKNDTSINPTNLTSFGSATWADLDAMANVALPANGTYNGIGPVVSGLTCVTSNTSNWGDPLIAGTPCASYFPIIRFQGAITDVTKLTGGYGQGIMVVDGDLEVSGGFQFYGPVVVKGHFKTTGTGGHFNGGVIAADVNLEQNTVLGNALVDYSSCTLARVLNATASGAQMRERGWMNVY